MNVEVVERSGLSPTALSPWDRGAPDDASVKPGTGSGFVVDPRGLVLTNQHLVENALRIYVSFSDGRRMEAKTVGSDSSTDVALLRLLSSAPLTNEDGLEPEDEVPTAEPVGALRFAGLKLADSEKLNVGDWVVALGNPSGQSITASAGIVSAKSRSLQRSGATGDFLQTDAAIHPGNSGGPLVNLKGEVVGLSTALLGGGTGIGFAVSGHTLLSLVPQLDKTGHRARGWLGAYVKDLTPQLAEQFSVPLKRGAVVTSRLEDSPASRGGLQQDDVIARVDSRPVESAGALGRLLLAKAPGTTLAFTIYRAKKKRALHVRIGELPDWLPVEGTEERQSTLRPLDALGLTLGVAPDGKKGARVDFVRPGSPAAQAGLREGALIHEAAGVPVRSASDVESQLRKAGRGSRVLLRLELPQLPFPRLRAVRVP